MTGRSDRDKTHLLGGLLLLGSGLLLGGSLLLGRGGELLLGLGGELVRGLDLDELAGLDSLLEGSPQNVGSRDGLNDSIVSEESGE